jgi:hypothetical protein
MSISGNLKSLPVPPNSKSRLVVQRDSLMT